MPVNDKVLKRFFREKPEQARKAKDKILKGMRIDIQQFVSDNFRQERFQDEPAKPWQKRQSGNASRNLLVDTGTLRNSITTVRSGDSIRVQSDVKYAARHNEGLDGMPERRFIGRSAVLTRKLKNEIQKELLKQIRK